MRLGYVDGIVAWAGAPRRLASRDQTVFILVWFFSLYLHQTTNTHFILPSPSFLLRHRGFIIKRLSACVLPSSIKWFPVQSPSRSLTGTHSRYPSLPSLPLAFTFLNLFSTLQNQHKIFLNEMVWCTADSITDSGRTKDFYRYEQVG